MLAIDPIIEPKPPIFEPKNKDSAKLVNLPIKIVEGTFEIN